ncbi:aldo/keto reductase [Sphingomonas nostoxanthinifaciens]|uniref:aldo/keto reductase n=1 Tax=Sphingomonas nostoxanthinifaciens TaxID=2872652 RepID=UPI001CC1D7F1|nr:aldo/keto reductase [Sphingomonas nostoxanthinifaciens]UAK25815.1 aldo/keto reductase [Sphingomonas nostoxanthinifaciens]
MDYKNLGKTGLKVSRITLGCMSFGSPSWAPWVLEEAASQRIIAQALDLGINTFDTADMYSLGASEEIVGRALASTPRHRLVIATKLNAAMSDDPNDRGLSRKHVFAAIDASLRRLGTDHVDLYQIHRFDPDTPLEETLEALDEVVRAGKVRYLGASSMGAWQFMKALGLQRQHGWAPFVSMQNHYNLMYREEEREMLPLCRSEGIGVIPWSPLARGRLAGRSGTTRAASDKTAGTLYDNDRSSEEAVVAAVRTVAERHGVPMAEVAYAWVATRPGITSPIVGATKPEHLETAIKALDLTLSAEDVALLEAPYRPQPVAGHV